MISPNTPTTTNKLKISHFRELYKSLKTPFPPINWLILGMLIGLENRWINLKTQQTGVKATGNVDVTANVGVGGNVFVGSYVSINKTDPAATDALTVNGNIRITAGQLIFADGSGQAAGSTVVAFPTGDYGLLDTANASADAFGQITSGLETFDMLSQPIGSVDPEDLGALS